MNPDQHILVFRDDIDAALTDPGLKAQLHYICDQYIRKSEILREIIHEFNPMKYHEEGTGRKVVMVNFEKKSLALEEKKK